MKTNLCSLVVCICFYASTINAQQVDVLASPSSELTINTTPDNNYSAYILADHDGSQSTAVYAKAFNVTGFGDISNAIVGDANFSSAPNFAYGIFGTAVRDSPSFDGRSIGVYGQAADATPGANYGVFGRLLGTNNGTAVLGHDDILQPGWNLVLPNLTSYAGYFRGKGYFHDNLGVGEEDPKDKVHVAGGNVYVADSVNGVILQSPTAGCYMIQVDDTGALVTTSVTCP